MTVPTTRPRPAPIEALPHDPDAEASVLGAMLLSPSAAADAVELLDADQFYDGAHALIFTVLVGLLEESGSLDVVTAVEELRRRDVLEEVGGALRIHELTNAVPVPRNVAAYAAIVATHSHARRIIRAAAEATEAARTGDVDGALRALSTVQVDAPSGFNPEPLDLAALEEIEEPAMLEEPYVPERALVWVVGPAESVKSLWALDLAARQTVAGRRVVFISGENPLSEDARRLRRLGPAPERLAFFHGPGLDLADPRHVRWVLRAAAGADLVVLDSLAACWSGDEDSNAEINGLDHRLFAPLRHEIGATLVVLDHVGHPQPFGIRRGVHAGRGASRKGQVADVVLEFRSEGPGRFLIHHAKNRFGGRRAPDATFEVVDLPDGGLTIAATESPSSSRVRELADAMVEVIAGATEPLTSKVLRSAVRGGAKEMTEAMQQLEAEEPPRVVCDEELVPTRQGKQRARIWRLFEPGSEQPEGVRAPMSIGGPRTPSDNLDPAEAVRSGDEQP